MGVGPTDLGSMDLTVLGVWVGGLGRYAAHFRWVGELEVEVEVRVGGDGDRDVGMRMDVVGVGEYARSLLFVAAWMEGGRVAGSQPFLGDGMEE